MILVYNGNVFSLKVDFLFSDVENKKASDARKVCWDGTGVGNPIGFWECHTQGGNQLFKYVPDKKQFIHSPSRACATAHEVLLQRRKNE